MKNRRNKNLTVRVTRNGVLTIEIGVETLAFAALRADFAWEMTCPNSPHEIDPRTKFRISDAQGFAVDVQRELTEEAEDGSSMLTRLLDDACEKAIEQGSEFFFDKEDDWQTDVP